MNKRRLPSGETSRLVSDANALTISVAGPPSIGTIHGDCTPLRWARKITLLLSGVTIGESASPDASCTGLAPADASSFHKPSMSANTIVLPSVVAPGRVPRDVIATGGPMPGVTLTIACVPFAVES